MDRDSYLKVFDKYTVASRRFKSIRNAIVKAQQYLTEIPQAMKQAHDVNNSGHSRSYGSNSLSTIAAADWPTLAAISDVVKAVDLAAEELAAAWKRLKPEDKSGLAAPDFLDLAT